jgi:hypothetical protein
VLPSIGLENAAQSVESLLPFFLSWRKAHDLPNIESSGPVPLVEQGSVRRLHRRTTA